MFLLSLLFAFESLTDFIHSFLQEMLLVLEFVLNVCQQFSLLVQQLFSRVDSLEQAFGWG
jgi:hypothetical protein